MNKIIPVVPLSLIALVISFWAISMLTDTRPSAAAPAAAPAPLDLSLIPFATSGLNGPLSIANAGDARLFVLEQEGRIKIVESTGNVMLTPFLDITDRVDSSENELGLLGLAFHPNYATNGFFYVNYTHNSGSPWRTRISRFQVTADTNVADPGSEVILLTVDQPHSNHNAGDIHFGPDGYLYIPLGDGGTNTNAQTLTTLLGKIVRIDVDANSGLAPDCQGSATTGSYTIPSTNPFMDGLGGTCDEIWAIGFRNPWRSSFDRMTGDFYVGDVGEGSWEEVDYQPATSNGGENYGWRCYEGDHHEFNTSGCGPIETYTFPIFEYPNPPGSCASVIGGYVYRGNDFPVMIGRYLLADYCSGNFWDLARDGGSWVATKYTNLAQFGFVAFGEDQNGELYVANISNNTIYRLVENSPVARYFFPLILKQS